jgi:dienelactone hydrolase
MVIKMKKSTSFVLTALSLITAFIQPATAAPLADLAGGQTGRIEFSSITPASMWTYARKNMTDTKPVVVFGDLLLPKAVNGKVPALVLSHGSTGVSPSAFDVWAAQMNASGVAVFVVDSFKPRGISETAADQGLLSPAANVADALNALKILATHPQIDASRIFHIGFSRGGGTAFYTAWPMFQRPVDTGGARFAGHIPVYPAACNIRYRADANVKATAPVFMAAADRAMEDWQDSAVCERFAKELAASGQPVTYKEYPDTAHGWDGRSKFNYFPNAATAKGCDMELQMTDVAGGGLGRDARDLKSGKALISFADWDSAVKACMTNTLARLGGNQTQSDALVKDVLDFMKISK